MPGYIANSQDAATRSGPISVYDIQACSMLQVGLCMQLKVRTYMTVQQTHYSFTHSVCIHRTARTPPAEQKAAKETVTVKPQTFEQTCTDKQLEDPRYYSDPDKIYTEMDDF